MYRRRKVIYLHFLAYMLHKLLLHSRPQLVQVNLLLLQCDLYLLQLKRTKCGHHFGATIVLVRPSATPCDRSHLRATITVVVDFSCMRPTCGGNHGSFLPCKRKCSLARPFQGNYYQSIKSNQIRNYQVASRMYIFPEMKPWRQHGP